MLLFRSGPSCYSGKVLIITMKWNHPSEHVLHPSSFEEKIRGKDFSCCKHPTDIENDNCKNVPCGWTPELSHSAVSGPRAAWLAGAGAQSRSELAGAGRDMERRLVITSDLWSRARGGETDWAVWRVWSLNKPKYRHWSRSRLAGFVLNLFYNWWS